MASPVFTFFFLFFACESSNALSVFPETGATEGLGYNVWSLRKSGEANTKEVVTKENKI